MRQIILAIQRLGMMKQLMASVLGLSLADFLSTWVGVNWFHIPEVNPLMAALMRNNWMFPTVKLSSIAFLAFVFMLLHKIASKPLPKHEGKWVRMIAYVSLAGMVAGYLLAVGNNVFQILISL